MKEKRDRIKVNFKESLAYRPEFRRLSSAAANLFPKKEEENGEKEKDKRTLSSREK